MAETLPIIIKGNVVGFSGIDVCKTGLNFYGVRGLFSPAEVSKTIAYADVADIELEVNRFAADNVTIHFKDPKQHSFLFQTYKDVGPRIVNAVKELLQSGQAD